MLNVDLCLSCDSLYISVPFLTFKNENEAEKLIKKHLSKAKIVFEKGVPAIKVVFLKKSYFFYNKEVLIKKSDLNLEDLIKKYGPGKPLKVEGIYLNFKKV